MDRELGRACLLVLFIEPSEMLHGNSLLIARQSITRTRLVLFPDIRRKLSRNVGLGRMFMLGPPHCCPPGGSTGYLATGNYGV